MSRDHYKGVPKKRVALFNSDGDLEALEKGGAIKEIVGTATLVGSTGTVTVTGTQFTTDCYAFVSPKHPYPSTDGLNWFVGDGYLTISGSTAGSYTVAYRVYKP